jgi:hypothetical protein
MKQLLVLSLFIGLSHSAFAANKICFGLDDAKGSHVLIYLTPNSLTVTSAAGSASNGIDGTHNLLGTVDGHDGSEYLEFDAAATDEGGTSILVDQNLHNSGTQGLIKIRLRGETFQESKFLCRDSQ